MVEEVVGVQVVRVVVGMGREVVVIVIVVIVVVVVVVVENLETEIRMNALKATVNKKKMTAKHIIPTIR